MGERQSWLQSRVLRLTLLAPDIVEAILDGAAAGGAGAGDMLAGFPLVWERQRKAFDACS